MQRYTNITIATTNQEEYIQAIECAARRCQCPGIAGEIAEAVYGLRAESVALNRVKLDIEAAIRCLKVGEEKALDKKFKAKKNDHDRVAMIYKHRAAPTTQHGGERRK
ncbi:MAG TPA: hypothetical protein VGE45_00555 [Chloroflexia bacterium]|jgi:hypothetical protein